MDPKEDKKLETEEQKKVPEKEQPKKKKGKLFGDPLVLIEQ